MARHSKRRGRPVNGIILLDKPVGMSSNRALQTVKHLFQANKAGHTGNLDPLASGMLPICLGEATKLSAFLLDADKIYVGTCKLGQRTATGDAEGEVIEEAPVGTLDEARVRAVLESFVGEIEQMPPMHSAIKQNGQPLYKLARQGIEVERKPRQVVIHALELQRLSGDELEIYVHCSKGTYIRTLAEDIGKALGTVAHLSQLRRLGVGAFEADNMVSLEALAGLAEEGMEVLDRQLMPMELALEGWPRVQLTENTLFYVRQGQPVLIPQAPTRGWVRMFSPQGQFVGVGQVLDDGRIGPKRLLNLN